ncbi:hypothetical protein [Hoylesella enoeca]|uniref:hypothetical protein n=1 Tax=Hoylesella enoeca TaxID=76123 RepID=UPI00288BD5EB|nr:hypothetical protein [Hoylesella enoeca]
MKTRVLLFGIAFGAIALTSCSNDDNAREEKEETQSVRFTITEEGFGTDTELTSTAATAQPQIIDAGDCEAEVSLENAPVEKQAATRAVTTPVHYTIRAYYNGVQRGELKGTFSATGFTPDAGTPTEMELGKNRTYDFVCFNDDVTPNGNNLEVTLSKAATARIGRQTIAIGTTDQTINLSSKHAGCRLQTQVVAKKDIPTAMTSTIESIGSTLPQTVSYDPATDAYTVTATTTMAALANNSPASAETKYSASNYGLTYSYTSSAPYLYFLPGMDAANLKLNNLSGTIFWKPFSMNIAKLSATAKSLEANGSYIIKIKMKPQYTYLMSDGTTGFFRETTYGGGTKTPIAIVLSQSNRMAMALKDVGGSTSTAKMNWCIWTYNTTQTNTHYVIDPKDALNVSATSGKDETWDASYSTAAVTGNKVKGKNADFTAFKTAADYDPGVAYTGSPALKWYLPSYSDFKWVFPLGFGDKTAVTQTLHDYDWYGHLAEEAFTQVGGMQISGKVFWSSSECWEYRWTTGVVAIGTWNMMWTYVYMRNNPNNVRPFVVY